MSADGGVPARRVRSIGEDFLRAATSVRVPLRHRLVYWFHYIGLARRGVMKYSPTRDAQYEDGFFKRGYDRACEAINRDLHRAPLKPEPIDVPSFQQGELGIAEIRLLMGMNVPFVIRGGARVLPMAKWTLDHLTAVAGSCEVPINAAADRPSEDTSLPTKASNYYDFRRGTLSEVVDSIRHGGHMRVSVAEDVMHHDGARLRNDLDIPYFERLTGWSDNKHHWRRSRLFVGLVTGAQLLLQPGSAYSLWHAEPGDNFVALNHGVKTWTLAHPDYTAAMRPRVKTTTNYFGSNIDIRESDDVQRQRGFEGYLHVPLVRVVIRDGDLLRVPNHWWHTVVTEPGDYTLSVSIRSNSAPNLTGFGMAILRMRDSQYHELAKAFAVEGRISDRHIGYPRRSRGGGDPAAPEAPRGADAAQRA